jgi:hypothetical protein
MQIKSGTVDQLTYSISGASDVSGISRRKFWAAIAAGDVEVVRIGGRTLIPRGSLLRYLKIDADGNPLQEKTA